MKGRGQKLGLLLLFWVSGGVFVAGLGWLIIPRDSELCGLCEDFNTNAFS